MTRFSYVDDARYTLAAAGEIGATMAINLADAILVLTEETTKLRTERDLLRDLLTEAMRP